MTTLPEECEVQLFEDQYNINILLEADFAICVHIFKK